MELLNRIEQEGFEIEHIEDGEYLIKDINGKEAVLTMADGYAIVTNNEGLETHIYDSKPSLIISELLDAMNYDFEKEQKKKQLAKARKNKFDDLLEHFD